MSDIGCRKASLHILFVTALAVLGGCAPDNPYNGPRFPFMRSYIGAQNSAPTLLSNAEWWKGFKDPTLNALIDVALVDSLQLATARERVNEAEANLQGISTTGVSASPTVNGRVQGSDGGPTTRRGTADLNFSWLLDPYGARRETLKAARARIEVADVEVNAARLLVLYNLSNAYVELRHNQRLLALRHQELRTRRQTSALTQSMFDANSATRLDIVRAQAGVADIQAQIPLIEADIQSNKNQIATLAGVAPGALRVNLDKGAAQPRAQMSTEVGIPADLVRNRPDIRIAERLYYAAVAETGAARAALYPKLSLIGMISVGIGRGADTGYSFGPQLELPTLPGKAAKAGVAAAQSRASRAQLSWKATVIEGILQVENALKDYQSSGTAVRASERAVRLYREGLGLTQELVKTGGATITDLITAQNSISEANTVLARNLRRQSLSFIALNVGLGSGNAAGEPVAVQQVAASAP